MAHPPLTPLEIEVLWLLTEGLSNKLIGDRLGLSPHTVKFHLEQSSLKLGIDGRVALAVAIALSNPIEAAKRGIAYPLVDLTPAKARGTRPLKIPTTKPREAS